MDFWSWLLVFFLALGFDGAFMHPFCVCTVGLLLLADIFEWSWKKLAVSMSIMLVLWGFIIKLVDTTGASTHCGGGVG